MVAPIGNRLYRRLAAGLAAEVTSQDSFLQKRLLNRAWENFVQRPGARSLRFWS